MDDLSTKPYLIRAIYEWCGDHGMTPYLAVKVDAHTRVPPEHVKNGEIVLNIGAAATHNLVLGNEAIHFSARFGGVAREMVVPIAAVSGIYAKESGQGLLFQVAPVSDAAVMQAATTTPAPAPAGAEDESHQPSPPSGGKPHLHIVK